MQHGFSTDRISAWSGWLWDGFSRNEKFSHIIRNSALTFTPRPRQTNAPARALQSFVCPIRQFRFPLSGQQPLRVHLSVCVRLCFSLHRSVSVVFCVPRTDRGEPATTLKRIGESPWSALSDGYGFPKAICSCGPGGARGRASLDSCVLVASQPAAARSKSRSTLHLGFNHARTSNYILFSHSGSLAEDKLNPCGTTKASAWKAAAATGQTTMA